MKRRYIDPDEMRIDIEKMLVVIKAFTPKNTYGADMLQEWIEKYRVDEE